MTYRAGMGPRLRATLGATDWPAEPTIYCDTPGCGERRAIGFPSEFFLRHRYIRGWECIRGEDVKREDYCPRCKRERAEAGR